MRHMAYVPGVALLAALVAGCSSGSGAHDSGADGKPGSPTVTAAPGKYRTLPESCRAVPRSTLKDLLPGAADLSEEQQEKVYAGTPAVTYDNDRKVGCRWKSEAPDASRNLSIDFERVVSYDPSVSDDDRAREVFAKQQDTALPELAGSGPGSASPGSPSASASTPSTTPSADGDDGADQGDDGGGAVDDLRPRLLDGLGDAAFLDDALARAGSTAQNRTVSVVFRTSNVIVTVRYTEQPALATEVPDSKELQEKAQALARQLSETLSA
ncbi:hypothetical protein K373_04571 [Streptomyces sp. DvalAA-21]|nr:conserved hypothetical protein [Streptomyces sp. SirexAA-E]PZX35353.1 hypothetical protein K373_04571 [Streptomyces sp. DvalAA-21]RAJ30120.1 hypothetical protein K351_05059 [Streptomyces sp. DpondAA-E10]RAJ44566.1 hypothetical protein K352_04798 [Streptomyces sp. DpondAA-A50]SCE55326.1 hypothetical protein GA0115235_12626 [Streptomyces sp. DpondAA-F4a]SCM01994.1 hypothetical protein SAMN04883147_10546 [Streptomyces sp. DpondAA-F4]